MLVVDDNAAARVLMVKALRAWGARPTEVASLEAALVELRSAAYEAVVIDDPLPDGAALTLLQQLRALASDQAAGHPPGELREPDTGVAGMRIAGSMPKSPSRCAWRAACGR